MRRAQLLLGLAAGVAAATGLAYVAAPPSALAIVAIAGEPVTA